jgi:predicted ATP-grasp superfamily ATP-dependent carboligase
MTSTDGLRILALEYSTGGGLAGEEQQAGLAREGELMLGALLRDLGGIPSVRVLSTRDARLEVPRTPARFSVPGGGEDIWAFWAQQMARADALWPIAPETGGLLERMSRIAGDNGKILIGSAPETVRIAGSKIATAELLARTGLSVVPTAPARNPPPASGTGWVVKPDDGVSADETLVFKDASEMSAWIEAKADASRFVVQPYLEGVAASISALFRGGRASVLSCNRQDIARGGGGFRYLGFEVGALEDMRAPFEKIASAVATAMPGLSGYAGIDLILTGDGPVVLEVNPRLTTSYAGLSRALGRNAAQLILDAAAGKELPAVRPARSVRVAVEGADG